MSSFFIAVGVVIVLAVAIGGFAMIHPYETQRQKTIVHFAFKLGAGLLLATILAVMLVLRQGQTTQGGSDSTTVIEEVE